MARSESSSVGGHAAFSHPDFVVYIVARCFIILALEMQSVAVAWQVYEITRRPLDLGYVGLAQFLPGFLLFLPSGHALDRFDRGRILLLCYGGFAVCSALLLELACRGPASVRPIYATLILLGAVRAFNGPAGQAILPQLIPEEHFPNAVAWAASARTSATILGPAAGGIIYAIFHGPAAVYVAAVSSSAIAAVSMLRIKARPQAAREPVTLTTVLAGLRYIRIKKIILGAILLDLFAVLLGGAVALLPVYAREILHTGPWGLGVLRSAPGVGAAAMAALLAYRPLQRRAGVTMFLCVTGFGVFTIVFGLSRNFYLSFFALLMVGATDMVSVIIRSTLIQLATPDAMRGRVSSVNMLFIGASNEFGEFESGLTAAWFGTVPAVILGGVGTLIVTAIAAWRFPELRQVNRLAGDLMPKDEH
ncbi:MAG: MFS transporter [Acidobacteriales bacterium]|nr:MFS transporter [Terriglobales bacterium]